MRLIQGVWMPNPNPMVCSPLAEKDVGLAIEAPRYKRALKFCRSKKRTAIDVGAHVGIFTRTMARDFRRVIAFEPWPPFVKCFRRNINARNVEFYPNAVGDQVGEIFMEAQSNVPPRVGPGGVGVIVRTIDSLKLEQVDFIKIDVEGYELAVLRGAVATLERSCPTVLLEQHPEITPMNYGFRWLEAIEFLEGMGAELRWKMGNDYCLNWV